MPLAKYGKVWLGSAVQAVRVGSSCTSGPKVLTCLDTFAGSPVMVHSGGMSSETAVVAGCKRAHTAGSNYKRPVCTQPAEMVVHGKVPPQQPVNHLRRSLQLQCITDRIAESNAHGVRFPRNTV